MSGFMLFLGAGLLAVGLLLGGLAVQALADRLRFGSGLLFADVELFTLGALAALGLGAGALWLGRKFRKRWSLLVE
ncbi:MAG: hypothetical protein FJ128_14320 [Deltaproteobacteria bacterium]|nr:hypothetical protein [Deltaproteobacteria bacterium]